MPKGVTTPVAPTATPWHASPAARSDADSTTTSTHAIGATSAHTAVTASHKIRYMAKNRSNMEKLHLREKTAADECVSALV